MVKRDSLLRENPLFFRFWFSRLISVVGSTSTRIAIPLEVLKLTESASLAALVTTVALAPILILGIPAGAFADHSSRVFIMRVAELASAITTATLAAILLLLGFLSPALLISVALLSIFAVFFDACSFGLLPDLVPKERLGQANGLLYGNNTVISLLGPVIAGFLYAQFGLIFVLLINSATFSVSAFLLFTLTKDNSSNKGMRQTLRSMPKSMVEGLDIIWRSHLLRYLVGSGAASGVAGGALSACMAIIAVERFRGGGELVGLFVSAIGAGAFLASLLLSFLSERFPQSQITLITMPFAVLSFFGVALAPTPLIMTLCCFAWGSCYTTLIVNNVTIRQSILPDHFQARVNSTARTIAWGGEPIGAGLSALLLKFSSDQATLLIISVPFIIAAIMAPFTPLRKRVLEPIA
ncbi:MFS transporter [Corynebacterium propinquum]|uniref:MFS transporter n=1 Tax=Corynebacterium propinquum TaxID=43769 RepID=UPI00138661E1|nr:MFS transporter [Corynebacterium propinquum]